MSLATIIEAMEAACIPAEQILIAVKNYAKKTEIEKAESDAQKRESARQRKIKSRKNNKPVTVTSVTSCDTSPPLVPPSNGFPTPLPITPPLNPPTSPSLRSGLPKTRARKLDYPDEFEEFWKIYPTNGASKQSAFQSYLKATANGADHDAIRTACHSYIRFLRATGTPTAHATTWINQQRWTVDYEALANEEPGRNSSGLSNGGRSKRQQTTRSFLEEGEALAAFYRSGASENSIHSGGQGTTGEPAKPSMRDAESLREGHAGLESAGGGLLLDSRPIHDAADHGSIEGIHADTGRYTDPGKYRLLN